MNRYILLILIPFLLAAKATTRPTHLDGLKPDDFFGLTKTWTIHLRVTPAAWKMMQPRRASRLAMLLGSSTPAASTQPATRPRYVEGERLYPNPFGLEYAYVRATVEVDGAVFNDVGLRFKGNSSYTSVVAGLRRPFKLDFNRFVQGQKLCGLSCINLHNNAFDPTHMREALSYRVYRKSGVPAPRTAFALVYLTVEGQHNREYLGLYTIVEQIDRDFLKDRFGSNKGLLLKPEGARGGMPYLGENWAGYEDRYRPKTYPATSASRRIIELARLIEKADDQTFRRQIDSYLNTDEFLRFFAATTLLANLDSFMVTNHNFYLYVNPADLRVYWMPWDLNLSFGAFSFIADADDQMHLSIDHPHIAANRLLDRLLGIDEFKAAYHRHLQRAIETSFSPAKVHGWIGRIERDVIRRADAAAKAAGKAGSPTTRTATSAWLVPPPDLRVFVSRRVESVAAQLRGEEKGVIPGRNRRRPIAQPARPVTRPAR